MPRSIFVAVAFGCATLLAADAVAKNPKGFKPAPLGLFGIELGAPWNIPACDNAIEHKEMCAENEGASSSAPDLTNYEVAFSAASPGPPYLKFRNFHVYVRDGIAEKITVFTTGVASQNEVLAELIVKFGEADKTEKSAVENGFGARAEAVDCTWTLPAGTVEFLGVVGDLESGAIVAETKEQAARDGAEQKGVSHL